MDNIKICFFSVFTLVLFLHPPAFSEDSLSFKGSCNSSHVDGECVNFVSEDSSVDADYCKSTFGGTYSMSNCPKDKSLGSCKVNLESGKIREFVYYPPQHTEENATETCTGLGGQFSK